MVIGTIVSMVLILMLSAVNRATGDDLGYGLLTHYAWLDTHSLTEVFKAMCQTYIIFIIRGREPGFLLLYLRYSRKCLGRMHTGLLPRLCYCFLE